MVLFSLALSLDGFGVGLSYGMRKIKITAISFVIICLSSALAVALAMFLGNIISSLLPPLAADALGAGILVVVGAWILFQNFVLNLIPDHRVFNINVPNLGLVINILKEPVEADQDKSGIIDVREAYFLGAALAMDALGAGLGAAISGYSPLLTPLFVACAKFILVSLGLTLGGRISLEKHKGEMSLVPGGVLMLLGLKKLMQI